MPPVVALSWPSSQISTPAGSLTKNRLAAVRISSTSRVSVWREAMLTADPSAFARHLAKPDGEDDLEWQIVLLRANEAAARLLWPLGDTGLGMRLHRIAAPTLIVTGDKDQVLPRSYAKKFVRVLDGKAKLEAVAGAGHLVDLDAPEKLAKVVLAHCGAAATAAKSTKAGARKPAKRAAIPKRKAAAKARRPARRKR